MTKITIGIDIAKQKFDVAYKSTDQRWRQSQFPNTSEGFEKLLKWLEPDFSKDIHAVMEATGRYGEDLALFLYLAGHQVSIVNPAQIKYYGRSLLRRSKTDKIDSRLIAEFAERHALAPWAPLSPSLQALKEQVRCLNVFKRDATQTSNRLEAAKDPMVCAMHKKHLDYIRKQIKDLESAIKDLIKKDPSLEKQVGLLASIPGIGVVSAWNLLAELPDLETFKCAKQLAAYAGLNPSIRTSGSSVKGRESMSKMGSHLLRKVLYFPAMSIMGRQTAMKPFIDKLRSRGKKGKVIVGAVMHKLLHIIFGVIKKQVAFQN
jgi:transposase